MNATDSSPTDAPATCPTCGRPLRRDPAPAPRGPGSTPEGRAAARALYTQLRSTR